MEFDLDHAFGFMLRRMYAASNLQFQSLTPTPDITAIQATVLLLVFREEIVGVRELARRMKIDRSTMQEVVKRMAKRGFLDRESSEHDRRKFRLIITEEGLAVLNRNIDLMSQLEGKFLSDIPPQDVAIIKAAFTKVLSRMED